MKTTNLLLLLVVLNFVSCKQKQNVTIYNIGQRSYKVTDIERERPLEVEIWYPTTDKLQAKKENPKALFKSINTIKNAKCVAKKFPLLIVSHGTGGNRFSLTWFIEKMVKEGYIVVSLGHYGNTTFNKLPREFVKWWERAIDIQFILDYVFADKDWIPFIDTEKIGGVGFSLGGYTQIALAGGLVDRTYNEGDEENKKRELPPEFPKSAALIDFDTDSLIVASYARYKDKVKDSRMKAFFTMAPAIGFGFHSKEQTQDITDPIYIVASKGDTNTPIAFNALNYHKLIPTSELYLLGEKIDHYVFLNEATDLGKKLAPKITIDAEGVDRKQIHDEVTNLAIEFFKKNLK